MARLYQGSFGAGELSPQMWGRIDTERFQSGVRVGRNVFFRPEGGADARPGLQWVGYTLQTITADTRLIPFKFNNEQTYMIVAHGSNLFFIKDGGVVIRDMPAGTPSVLQDATGVYVDHTSHGFTGNERLFWVSGGYDQLEGRWVKVDPVNSTADRIYLLDYITSDNIDGSSFTQAYSSFNPILYGHIFSLGSAQGWFTDVPVEELDFTQANDQLFVSHGQDATKVITRGASDLDWTIADFSPSPSVAAPTADEDTDNNPTVPTIYDGTGLTRANGTDSLDYAVTAIDNETYEESLATQFTISSIDPTLFAPPAATGVGASIAITHQSGADTYRIYRAIGGIYGLIGSVNGTSGTLYFDDTGFTPNLSIAPPLEVNPEFNASGGYPNVVELFQERIHFGNTNDKLRDYYASRAGSFSSFASSTVNTADDPIAKQIAAKSVQEVRFFVALRDLVILTSDGVWGFDNGDSGALTPDSGLVSYSFWGSARVKPALVGDAAVYVSEGGSGLRDLAYSLQSDGFSSSDITLLARHLFAGRTIKAVCYSEVPYSQIFCVMSDGRAVSCTYVRDQQIFAWSRHETSGRMLDCASVRENGVDNIYVVVERATDDSINVNGRYRQIERMVMTDPLFIDQGVYLDNSMQMMQGIDWEQPGELWNPRITNDELELHIDYSKVGRRIQIYDLQGSSLEALENVVFETSTAPAQGSGGETGFDWAVVRRSLFKDGTIEEFRWEDYLPDNYIEWREIGKIKTDTSALRKLYHLYYRGPVVSVRADGRYYSGITIGEFGEDNATLAFNRAANIHVGEPYTVEIETLDIDDIQDPVTGLPIQIGGILMRFAMSYGFQVGRSTRTLTPVNDLTMLEGFSIQTGAFQGVVDQTMYPEWVRGGKLVLRARPGFPFKLSAIVPLVEAGDVDA